MYNVIIIGGGNHHNTLGVVRSLGERGIPFLLITIGESKDNYVASSKYVLEQHHLFSTSDLYQFLISHKSDSINGIKEVIISCSDAITEELNEHYSELSKFYIVPGVCDEGVMKRLMSKTEMIRLMSNLGVCVPKVWKLPDELDSVTYPCITKGMISSHGGGKADIHIMQTKEELKAFLVANNNIFAQEYITKKEEVQFIGCSLNEGSEIVIPGMSKILRSQPNTNTGFLEYSTIDPFYSEIVEKSKSFIRECKYSGLFSVEFIRSEDDSVYFLETNFRNDGNAYSVTAAGVNLPAIWIKHSLGYNYSEEIKEIRPIVVMPEFQDFKLVLQRKLSLIQWLKDLRRTNCFLEWSVNDKKPFFKYIINYLKR